MADWKPNPQLEKVERDRLCAVRSTLVKTAYQMIDPVKDSKKKKKMQPWSKDQFLVMARTLEGIRDITETPKADTEMLYLDPSVPEPSPPLSEE